MFTQSMFSTPPPPPFGLPCGSSVAQSTDKACKQDAFVKLKFQSAQPTLTYRVGPSLDTAWHLADPLKVSLRPLGEGQC